MVDHETDFSAQIEQFFTSPQFGVVGASSRRNKFGNKIFRCYQQQNKPAIPVHPAERVIEGVDCVASVADLPDEVNSISIITPPQVTEKVVKLAIDKGIENIWMQPGAESETAVKLCTSAGINLIYGGTCLLVVLGFDDH
ncbi:MAG: CoA-binding protein [Desulfuromonas sp.]|nr:MAG: CoA-binding protein [Desulfuromonas sp.]